MGYPRFEVGFGAVDGTNLVFSVSTGYRPGSTAVFVNGQLKRADFEDGWEELSPASGLVKLRLAPVQDDIVQVFFTDSGTTSALPEGDITPLRGTIVASSELLGRLRLVEYIRGTVETAP